MLDDLRDRLSSHLMIDFNAPEYVDTNGITLACYRAGPLPSETDKPLIVFMHGFPELAYSWRAQLEVLGAEGYPVVAPDMRGYGKSSKPDGKTNYEMGVIVEDLKGLLNHYEATKAVFAGHDWGALVLWSLPFYCPERVLGLAGFNVPLVKQYPIDTISMLRAKFGDDMYIVRFQTEGDCESILEQDVAKTFRFFLRKPLLNRHEKPSVTFEAKNLDLLTLLQMGEEAWGGELLLPDEEMNYYIEAYENGGFTGPLHWYRNMAENWEAQKQFLVDGVLPKVNVPCLMFTADLDRACPAHLANGMEELCYPFTRVDLEGCGHWSQQEKADDVNEALIKWLEAHF